MREWPNYFFPRAPSFLLCNAVRPVLRWCGPHHSEEVVTREQQICESIVESGPELITPARKPLQGIQQRVWNLKTSQAMIQCGPYCSTAARSGSHRDTIKVFHERVSLPTAPQTCEQLLPLIYRLPTSPRVASKSVFCQPRTDWTRVGHKCTLLFVTSMVVTPDLSNSRRFFAPIDQLLSLAHCELSLLLSLYLTHAYSMPMHRISVGGYFCTCVNMYLRSRSNAI